MGSWHLWVFSSYLGIDLSLILPLFNPRNGITPTSWLTSQASMPTVIGWAGLAYSRPVSLRLMESPLRPLWIAPMGRAWTWTLWIPTSPMCCTAGWITRSIAGWWVPAELKSCSLHTSANQARSPPPHLEKLPFCGRGASLASQCNSSKQDRFLQVTFSLSAAFSVSCRWQKQTGLAAVSAQAAADKLLCPVSSHLGLSHFCYCDASCWM